MSAIVLPESTLRCMSPEDRRQLGKGGLTAAEATAKAEARNEKELQRQIYQFLRQRGYVAFRSRTDKRTTNNIGTPDFLLSVHGKSVALEVKTATGKTSPEQDRLHEQMVNSQNGWSLWVVGDVESVKRILDRLEGMA